MKKKVKSLIIAASVAAIAGIGAVSFAAWNSTTTDKATSGDVNTGSIEVTAGFVTTDSANPVTMSLADATKNLLMPYDQGGTLSAGQTKTLVFDIPDYQVKANTNYTLTLSTTFTDVEFKYQIGAAEASAPADSTGYADAAWKELSSATEVSETTSKVITGQKLTIIMNSDDFTDMNKTGTFTLTFAEATA